MKILITGPLGHIGSRLIHSLKSTDFEEVRLLDNLSTQRYVSLFNLPRGVNFKFSEEDICTADLDKYFAGVDIVIHLAAITDAASSFDKKELIERVNFEGTRRVALACLKSGSSLIFPSTTSVYGCQEELVDESCAYSDLKPQSPYAESKLKAEQLLQDFAKNSGLKLTIFRFGTIFGTSIGMRFHTAVNKFCWQAVMGEAVTVWRTALNQYRPYLDLGDAINAIRLVIRKKIFDGNVYNVVTLNETVGGILKIISTHVSDLKVEYVDTRIMNQLSYKVSAERFKKLGFRFCGNLQTGINDTIDLLKGSSCGLKK